tara:strand:- start:2916 stop:3983 length:1068 start_codon:yes stop_codon:yes gene_type:complete
MEIASSAPQTVAPQPPGKWRVVILGCGSSGSVPKLSCTAAQQSSRGGCVCNAVPLHPLNIRGTPSIILTKVFDTPQTEIYHNGNEIEVESFNLLVDCGKSFYNSAIKFFPVNKIKFIDAVFFTHFHADAILGLDDIREVQRKGTNMNVYADKKTMGIIRSVYSYLFPESEEILKIRSNLFVAACTSVLLNDYEPLLVDNLEITPVPLRHGNVMSLGYSFSEVGSNSQFIYFSDYRCKASNEDGTLTPDDIRNLSLFFDVEKSKKILEKKPISVMMLDALHPEYPYISHASLSESVALVRVFEEMKIEIGQVLLTGQSCTMDYFKVNVDLQKEFPNNKVRMSFDGLRFPLEGPAPV